MMTIGEAQDVTRIFSVAEQIPPETSQQHNQPLRVPHHAIRHVRLISGCK